MYRDDGGGFEAGRYHSMGQGQVEYVCQHSCQLPRTRSENTFRDAIRTGSLLDFNPAQRRSYIGGGENQWLVVWRYICLGCSCCVPSLKTSIEVVELIEEGDIRGGGGGRGGLAIGSTGSFPGGPAVADLFFLYICKDA